VRELADLLAGMDVPEQRKTDLRWLARNLAIRNGDHPNFEAAFVLIKTQIKIAEMA
jgi:hypothetical protein